MTRVNSFLRIEDLLTSICLKVLSACSVSCHWTMARTKRKLPFQKCMEILNSDSLSWSVPSLLYSRKSLSSPLTYVFSLLCEDQYEMHISLIYVRYSVNSTGR